MTHTIYYDHVLRLFRDAISNIMLTPTPGDYLLDVQDGKCVQYHRDLAVEGLYAYGLDIDLDGVVVEVQQEYVPCMEIVECE